MIENSEPFVRFGKSYFETAVRVADITLESMERLVDLQSQTAKEALEQGIRNVKTFSDVRNVQDLVALQSKAGQPNLEQALAYSRNVFAVATEAQERISRVLRTRMGELGGGIMTVVDHVAKSAPAPDAALAARKPVVAASGKVAPVRRALAQRKTAKKKGR